MCSLCVLKYTKGAFLTASSLLGNLFKDMYIYISFFWGGGGWGLESRRKIMTIFHETLTRKIIRSSPSYLKVISVPF